MRIKWRCYGREILSSCSSQYVFFNCLQVCVAVLFVFFTDGRSLNLGSKVNRLSAVSVFQLVYLAVSQKFSQKEMIPMAILLRPVDSERYTGNIVLVLSRRYALLGRRRKTSIISTWFCDHSCRFQIQWNAVNTDTKGTRILSARIFLVSVESELPEYTSRTHAF